MNGNHLPAYVKASVFFVGAWALFTMLYIARSVIIPLVFSAFIAIMLNPVVNFFHYRLKINRVISIFIALVITFMAIAGIILFLYAQISMFKESWPNLGVKINQLVDSIVHWASANFHVSKDNIDSSVEKARKQLSENSLSTVTTTLYTISSVLAFIFLLPVFVFLILFYKPMFINFILQVAGPENKGHASDIILGTRTVIQSYLNGLVIEAVIVSVMNAVGLFILGIQYAILLGVMGAILNVIPYIGGVIAVLVTMLIALLTKSPVYAIYVLILYMVVQFIDNQIIFPRIVGSKVEINALVSIVVVIAGGLFWGIAGMFLSLPIIAVIKIIFDRIEPLKPWGMVLGNILPAKPIYLSRHRHHKEKADPKPSEK